MRALLLPLVALLVGVAGCAAPEGSDSPPSSAASAETLAIELSDFMLEPSSLSVAGPAIAVDVTNAGPTPHNLSIRDAHGELVAETDDLSSGEAETLTAELEPGEYVIFCSLAGHESLGMTGTLTVTGEG